MNQMVVADAPKTRAERIQVYDPIPVLDTGRFEQMVRIAKLMAESNLIPETLCATYEGTGANRQTKWLPLNTVIANCFLIVNQAIGWGMDPFAVAQCASVVHGRVCYEGKLIAAVVEQKLGVRLSFEWDDKPGDAFGIIVTGKHAGEATPRTIRGTVGAWKTTGNNSPWIKQPRTQLAYRGARDWARLHAPSVMLGVYSIDEMEGAIARQERMPAPRSMMTEAPGETHAPAPAAKVASPRPTPPNPNKAASAPPKPQEQPKPTPFDIAEFRTAYLTAETDEAREAVYEREVTLRQPPLSDDEMDAVDAVTRESAPATWEGE